MLMFRTAIQLQTPARLEFCTFRDLANPCIDGHCRAAGEFWRVSVQTRVVKNEMAIPALQQCYATLYTPFTGVRADFDPLRRSSRVARWATQKRKTPAR